MKRKKKIQQLTLAAFFVALQIVMTVTPIGYIPVGALSITTMHIPVILSSILMGPQYGAMMGFVFGLSSMLKATFEPGITSFVFTPFVTVGGVTGNFASLLIVFAPRILLGIVPGALEQILSRHMNGNLSVAFSSAIATFLHTILVLGGIYLFFGEQYASVLGINLSALMAILLGVVATNGILETALAAIVEPLLVRALHPSAVRMGLVKA